MKTRSGACTASVNGHKRGSKQEAQCPVHGSANAASSASAIPSLLSRPKAPAGMVSLDLTFDDSMPTRPRGRISAKPVPKPSLSEYVRGVHESYPGKFDNESLRALYPLVPGQSVMTFKLNSAIRLFGDRVERLEGDRFVVETVQVAYGQRGQGVGVDMVRTALRETIAAGHKISEVAVESPNSNSIPWWDGPVAKMLRSEFPDLHVVEVPQETRDLIDSIDMPEESII